ncbi:MAG: hypothetical protein JXQ66_00260, partial [Campylobacterales bacterium]|nr:hypothetical protein [Campylobacterales bacterium]
MEKNRFLLWIVFVLSIYSNLGAVTFNSSLTLSEDITYNEDFTITSGTLDLNGNTLHVKGNLTLSDTAKLKMTN